MRTDTWLASLIARQGPGVLGRFGRFYDALAALPRRARRALQKRWAVSLAGAALLLALGFSAPPAAQAATIVVDGVNCTLADAIVAANTNTAVNGCTGGSGADVISLMTDVTLTSVHNMLYGPNGLPLVESAITIAGNGHTLARAAAAPPLRLLTVASGGNLTINHLDLQNGYTGNAAGGALLNVASTASASLTLNDSTVSGSSTTFAFGGGITNFGFPPYVATMTINRSTISGNSASASSTVGGGGIVNLGTTAHLTLNDSTVTGNTAASAAGGGGIVNANYSTYGVGSVTLNRSVVSGNTAGVGDDIRNDTGGTFTANNYNVLGDSGDTNAQAFAGFTPCSGAGCTDVSATSNGTQPTSRANILSATLADNGGPTLTHALAGGSPAVDLIPTSHPACNPPATTDQRGAVRADGLSRGGAGCDAGAFELGSVQTPSAVSLRSLAATRGAGWETAAAGAGALLVSLGLLRRRR